MTREDTVEAVRQTADAAAGAVAKLRLTRPHALIQRTLDIKVEKDQWGYTREPAWPGVDGRVSKPAKRDALVILDRLFKSLEKIEIKPTVQHGSYHENGTFAVRGEDRVQVYVTEETKKIPHIASEEELTYKKEHPYSARIPKFDAVPTGRLSLVPGGVADMSSEDALGTLIAIAIQEIFRHLDENQRQREAATVARRRQQEKEQDERSEKGRVEALHKAGPALQRYREMMEFIEEVRRSGRIPNDQRKEGQSLEEWLQWAEWQARCIHPLG